MSVEVIKFVASVSQVRTLADGGLRVVMDFSENDVLQAAQLIECKRFGVPLSVECKPVKQETSEVGKVSEGTKRKSEWAAA